MKVYTRTGDEGDTSLLSGGRVAKDHIRTEAYGTLDELSAVLGLLCCEPLPTEMLPHLQDVQKELFGLGAELADPKRRHTGHLDGRKPELLEQWIDAMDRDLPALRSFILPGGSRSAALAHLARTVCRRAERRVLTVKRQEGSIPEGALPYLNRLSDALFVLARTLNARLGIVDPEWKPRAPR